MRSARTCSLWDFDVSPVLLAPSVQVSSWFPAEAWWEDVCGYRRVHNYLPLFSALHQHTRQLPLSVRGWLWTQPQRPHHLQVHIGWGTLLARFCILLVSHCQIILRHMFSVCYLCAEEEPYLIFANRYYLRKLNLDGSNYTLIKQVRHTGSAETQQRELLIVSTPVHADLCSRVWIMQWHWTSTMQSRWSTGQMWPLRAAWSDACVWTAATWRSVRKSSKILQNALNDKIQLDK